MPFFKLTNGWYLPDTVRIDEKAQDCRQDAAEYRRA